MNKLHRFLLIAVGFIGVLLALAVSTFLGIHIWKFAITEYQVADKSILFRDLLTIVLAVTGVAVALLGFLAYQLIETRVSARATLVATNEVEEQRRRTSALVLSHLGSIYWQSYNDSLRKRYNTPPTGQYLNVAIRMAELASLYLSPLNEEKRENQKLICEVRNNLTYYYAERLDPTNKTLALDYAEYIRKNAPQYPDLAADWLSTYHFVRQRYLEQQEAPPKEA